MKLSQSLLGVTAVLAAMAASAPTDGLQKRDAADVEVRNDVSNDKRDDVATAKTLAADKSRLKQRDEDAHLLQKRGYWIGSWYIGFSKTEGLNCRSCPSTRCPAVDHYGNGESVAIGCQTTGQSISGNSVWDKTIRDCYVSDHLVETRYLWIPGMPGC